MVGKNSCAPKSNQTIDNGPILGSKELVRQQFKIFQDIKSNSVERAIENTKG